MLLELLYRVFIWEETKIAVGIRKRAVGIGKHQYLFITVLIVIQAQTIPAITWNGRIKKVKNTLSEVQTNCQRTYWRSLVLARNDSAFVGNKIDTT